MAAQQMKITLVANDGTKFEVSHEVAFQSQMVREKCENMDYPTDFEMDVFGADGKTLKKVIDYCVEFGGEEFRPIRPEVLERTNLNPQQERFLNVPDDFVREVLLTADYLTIPGLVAICYQKMVKMLKGKKARKSPVGKITKARKNPMRAAKSKKHGRPNMYRQK